LAILTAQRRDEIAGMRWSEIDLDGPTWILPGVRTKTGKPHIVHLSRPALAILAELYKSRGTTDWVFTTTGRSAISGFSRAKARLDELSGVSDWRLHDARRTFASHAVDMGIDATVADRVLNHVAAGSLSTVQRVYQRSEMLNQRRDALEAWGQHVMEITGQESA
jgi:integrase